MSIFGICEVTEGLTYVRNAIKVVIHLARLPENNIVMSLFNDMTKLTKIHHICIRHVKRKQIRQISFLRVKKKKN